jgi:2-polyprenyl-3-methyl-5-hydroxy-6-metoxy-1,4-benzoquinol methylase
MADSLVWVEVPCPLCGARQDETVLETPTQHGMSRLARCGECSMVYLNPRPADDCLDQLYPDDYEDYQPDERSRRPGWGRVADQLRRLALVRYRGYPSRRQRAIDGVLAPLGKVLLNRQGESMMHLPWVGEGRLLDYGCGSGWYGARMRELGWRVTVMDFNAKSVRRVWQRYGLPVVAGTLPHPHLRPESFDVVTMGCVLEHVPDPHQVIEGAMRILAPGGLLVIKVPSIASWSFRTFGADWWGLQLPWHLLHFSPETLGKLLESHGLDVEQCRMVPQGGWFRRSLRTARSQPGIGWAKRLLCRAAASSPVSRLISSWSVARGQAEAIKVIARKPHTHDTFRPANRRTSTESQATLAGSEA